MSTNQIKQEESWSTVILGNVGIGLSMLAFIIGSKQGLLTGAIYFAIIWLILFPIMILNPYGWWLEEGYRK